MFEKETLTMEEKIDFIYEKTKLQERRSWYRLYFRISLVLLFVVYGYYMYFFFLDGLKNQLMGSVIPKQGVTIDGATLEKLKGALESFTK